MSKQKFYITTTLPYVNADPHIGFAAEIIRADVLARRARLKGQDVFFNTGTDEHGLKIYRKAKEQKKDVQEYTDEYVVKFDNLKTALDLSYNSFVRTSDPGHMAAAQEFWRRCDKAGDIYKKEYKIRYCVGCEAEKSDSDLADGKCPQHPDQEPEIIEEENYFFRWSRYGDQLLKFYNDNPDFVIPNNRFNEIKKFIEIGLEDFSISRLKAKMPWGVPVPGDNDHVMYVWFDALTNYIFCLGWPDRIDKFNEFWPGIQVAGKDNLRFQSAMWPAMLMSAGLPLPKQILIFGFITSEGQKMSKSLGNVVSPYDLVEKYGTDAARYYLLAGLKPFEDADYTEGKFKAAYQADLANGIGNLAARVSNLLEKNNIKINIKSGSDKQLTARADLEMEKYSFDEALAVIWRKIRETDELLSARAPWKMEDKEEIKKVLETAAQNILDIAWELRPFMPATAAKLIDQFSQKTVKKGEPLFPRLKI